MKIMINLFVNVLMLSILILTSCVEPVKRKENIKDMAIFYSNSQRVQLQESEFTITLNKADGSFCLVDKNKVKLIRSLESPKLEFYIDDVLVVVLGVNISSSEVPNNIDWFFFENDEGIILVTDNGCIPIRKVGKK